MEILIYALAIVIIVMVVWMAVLAAKAMLKPITQRKRTVTDDGRERERC